MLTRNAWMLLWRISALMPLSMSPGAVALGDAEVADLKEKCELARQEALEPIREQRTQACIEQQLRSPEHCATYYSTYGNPRRLPSGAPSEGMFYDLPECQRWMEAQEELLRMRSKP